MLGPVAPACGAAAWKWHCTEWWLDERQRGECGASEKKKKVLLICSTTARIRVSRRAHVVQW
jgi:hypothetical protein